MKSKRTAVSRKVRSPRRLASTPRDAVTKTPAPLGVRSGDVARSPTVTASSADSRVQVAFRMQRPAYKELRKQALDEDLTINDLILSALNRYRVGKGLAPLES